MKIADKMLMIHLKKSINFQDQAFFKRSQGYEAQKLIFTDRLDWVVIPNPIADFVLLH